MEGKDNYEREEIFSKSVRAGRRTYFFDVRSTRADDYYMTITESKKFSHDDGSAHYKKHKIYLYKEDFNEFSSNLSEMTDYIIKEKGEEVISERHQKDYKKEEETTEELSEETESTEGEEESNDEAEESNDDDKDSSEFTDVKFEDI